MVAVPMYLLFEFSVIISTVVYRRRCKKLVDQGIDPDEQYLAKKAKWEKSSRWAAAKAAVESSDPKGK